MSITTMSPHAGVTPTRMNPIRWLEQGGPYLNVIALVLLAVGVATQSVDVTLAKGVLDVVVNGSEALSWAVAVGLTAAACALAAGIGVELRTTEGLARRWVVASLVVVWLGLGTSLFLVRYNEGSIIGGSNDPADLPIAALMAVLYLAAGLDIAIQSYVLANPRMGALWISGALIGRYERRHRRTAALLHAVREALADHSSALSRLDESYRAGLHLIDAFEADLKDHARLAMTAHLGDPARSSQIYRRPHEPAPIAAEAGSR